MKNAEIKDMTKEELVEKITFEQDALKKLVFAHAISPIENPLKIRANRRLIAQLNTELRNKEVDEILNLYLGKLKAEGSSEGSSITQAEFSKNISELQMTTGVKLSKKLTASVAAKLKVK